jgi:hypothetical protein
MMMRQHGDALPVAYNNDLSYDFTRPLPPGNAAPPPPRVAVRVHA